MPSFLFSILVTDVTIILTMGTLGRLQHIKSLHLLLTVLLLRVIMHFT